MQKIILIAAGLAILSTGIMAGKCEFNSPVVSQPEKKDETKTPAPEESK